MRFRAEASNSWICAPRASSTFASSRAPKLRNFEVGQFRVRRLNRPRRFRPHRAELGHQELVELGLHAVTRYQPKSDKVMRSRRCRRQRLSRQAKLCFAESMHAQTAMIENGFVHLPKEAGWRAECLHELTVFPGGKYDDQVDSTAQLLDWLKPAGREPRGIYQYYKELAQQPQTARSEPLSVMAKRLGLLRW